MRKPIYPTIREKDWLLSNHELAAKYKVLPATVSQWRSRFGKVRCPLISDRALKDADWTLRDADVARICNVSYASVRQYRTRHGIPPGKVGLMSRTSGAKQRPRADEWVLPDTELARRYGVTRQCVAYWRDIFVQHMRKAAK